MQNEWEKKHREEGREEKTLNGPLKFQIAWGKAEG